MKKTEEEKARRRARYAVDPEKERAQKRAWRAANREKEREYAAAYYAANPEKAQAASRAWKSANPEKIKVRKAAWYAANLEKIKARQATYRAANPEKIKAYYVANAEKLKAKWASGGPMASRRMQKYGLSPEAYQLMLSTQKNACGICKETFSETPRVDHCHKTGKVRGLLCGRCNKALGGFKDSPDLLRIAATYLENC